MHLEMALREEPHMPTLWLLRFQLQIATLPRKKWSVHSRMQTVAWGTPFCLGMISQISCEKVATAFKAQHSFGRSCRQSVEILQGVWRVAGGQPCEPHVLIYVHIWSMAAFLHLSFHWTV